MRHIESIDRIQSSAEGKDAILDVLEAWEDQDTAEEQCK